jgi:hypothetical protein
VLADENCFSAFQIGYATVITPTRNPRKLLQSPTTAREFHGVSRWFAWLSLGSVEIRGVLYAGALLCKHWIQDESSGF